MTLRTPSAGNNPALPSAILSATERDEIRDNLVLALDEIETGPVDARALRRLIAYQRSALKVTHMRAEAM